MHGIASCTPDARPPSWHLAAFEAGSSLFRISTSSTVDTAQSILASNAESTRVLSASARSSASLTNKSSLSGTKAERGAQSVSQSGATPRKTDRKCVQNAACHIPVLRNAHIRSFLRHFGDRLVHSIERLRKVTLNRCNGAQGVAQSAEPRGACRLRHAFLTIALSKSFPQLSSRGVPSKASRPPSYLAALPRSAAPSPPHAARPAPSSPANHPARSPYRSDSVWQRWATKVTSTDLPSCSTMPSCPTHLCSSTCCCRAPRPSTQVSNLVK